MPLWGNSDDAGNSAIQVLSQLNKATNTVNRTILFGNTTANIFVTGETVGQYGVDVNEQQARNATGVAAPTHAGWVLKTEGSGGRAGRVFYETLVAMGSIVGDAENVRFPQYGIVISTQPLSFSGSNTANVNLVVSAKATPNTQLYYQWQKDGGPGVQQFANVANSGVFASANGNTSTTLSISNTSVGVGQTLNGNVFRVVVSAPGANTIYSQNVTITVV